MTKESEEKKNYDKLKRLSKIGGIVLTALVTIFVIEYILFSNIFGPFSEIGGVSVRFLDKKSAVNKVTNEWEKYSKQKIKIHDEEYLVTDLVQGVNIERTAEEALKDQSNNIFLFKPLRNNQYNINLTLNDEKVDRILAEKKEEHTEAAQDAGIIISNGNYEITPEKTGKELNLTDTKRAIVSSLSNLNTFSDLVVNEVKPFITKEQAEKLKEAAKNATNSDLTVNSITGKEIITKEQLSKWLLIKRKSEKDANNSEVNFQDFNFYNENLVNDWVKKYSEKTNREPVNAKLNVKDGRVNIFVPSQTGYKVDEETLENSLQESALNNKTIEAKIAVSEPEIREENLNNLGIKELISTGYSDFTGSPTNRIHNVKTGASKFNGVLIKPGETFSFNKTLGPVDASTGYLPELVIVNNKTEPQYGGGLCQVSSTAFRAALNAGLPIVERSPHAYPVVYYKPYGVDATIYLPKPDLVFKNDTDGNILIQTRAEGTKLFFEFYGTKKARTVKFSGFQNASGAVDVVEKVEPYIYDQEARGKGSFSAVFYRHIYDTSGKMTDNDKFTSKYDSPDKYPH